MKILFAGNWLWPQYEKEFSNALRTLGCEITPFVFTEYFQGGFGYCQSVIPVPGPALWKVNNALIDKVRDSRPDVLFIWRGTHLLPRTLRTIKKYGAMIVSYNNDNPFHRIGAHNVPWHHHLLWHWHIQSLKYSDLTLVYRPINIPEARSVGAKKVGLLKPYFLPKLNRPVELSDSDRARFGCDVVFVGHYEADGREEYLKALVDSGLNVRLFGGGYWTKAVLGELSEYFGNISPVTGEDYAKALCCAQVCLAFLSRLNRDTYTRRCFEIPACGRLLLSERTEDLKAMFVEDSEAVFFSSKEELVEKASWLIKHPEVVSRIAEAGRKRVWADGHDVLSRAREFLGLVSETLEGRG